MENKQGLSKVTLASLIMTLGIIYGDIGTSPLYVMSAIIHANKGIIDATYVLGGISLVIWTLTLQTTIKYVSLILSADNNGEGGILSLYTLVRKKAKWLLLPAIIGSAALLADSIITPAVTVTSAIEGLKQVFPLTQQIIVVVVAFIISILFLIQRFGTEKIGKIFGPVMFIWFLMLALLGLGAMSQNLSILRALNPYYGIWLLFNSPTGVIILGAVFLCTTGAEALYSDLGHCGKANIHYTWIFVKLALVLNYLGQGAVLLRHQGELLVGNPFFNIMPGWFLLVGIGIATLAAIIASQSLISGSFTLVSEAIKLNLFPRLSITYPTNVKGQLYIPAINVWLWVGCMAILFHFQKSSSMEAAYGLSITVAMLMTTILYANYLVVKQISYWRVLPFLGIYLLIEGTFLYANLFKFLDGGYITLFIGLLIMAVMYIWIRGRKITESVRHEIEVYPYIEQLKQLQADVLVAKYSTNLVYLTKASSDSTVEENILHSILSDKPKKANVYWFVNIEVTDKPFTLDYKVDTIVPKSVFKIHFILGFRVEMNLSVLLPKVILELLKTGEIDPYDKKYYVNKHETVGECTFILFEQVLAGTAKMTLIDSYVLRLKLLLKKYTVSPQRWFSLDTSNFKVETTPLLIGKKVDAKLRRVK
ncbi:MAG: KUP/HAK/KT family potassium transporter [Culicoidibacterales bacterium]